MKLIFRLQTIETYRYIRQSIREQYAEYERMYKKAPPTIAKRLERRFRKLEIEDSKYYMKL